MQRLCIVISEHAAMYSHLDPAHNACTGRGGHRTESIEQHSCDLFHVDSVTSLSEVLVLVSHSFCLACFAWFPSQQKHWIKVPSIPRVTAVHGVRHGFK